MSLGAPLSASLAIHGAALALVALAPRVAPPVPRPLAVSIAHPPSQAMESRAVAAARPSAPRPVRADAAPKLPAVAPALSRDATGDVAQDVAAGDIRPAALAAAAMAESPPRYDAGYLDNPAPAYPAAARRRRAEGVVLLDVMVDEDGRPATVGIAASSGAPELDRAALDAVRAWRFVPARRGDAAVAGQVRVPLRFRIES